MIRLWGSCIKLDLILRVPFRRPGAGVKENIKEIEKRYRDLDEGEAFEASLQLAS